MMAVAKRIMKIIPILKAFIPHRKPQKLHSSQFPLAVPPEQTKRVLSTTHTGPVESAAAICDFEEDIITMKPNFTASAEKPVIALLTVKHNHNGTLTKLLQGGLSDKFSSNVIFQLISTEVDPKTKEPKRSKEIVLKDWSKKSTVKAETEQYTIEFTVDSDFGVPGAITVTNMHQREFFLETITVQGFACGPLHFPCNSWVQAKQDHPQKRVFFSNKPYLPSETPHGLRKLREKELSAIRGDGQGVRKSSERIYDYDLYNDLGNPDRGHQFTRPVLGGRTIPYPRRCRTGRPTANTDMQAESRIEKPFPIYVPRDDQFEKCKKDSFSAGRHKAALHSILPYMKTLISADNCDFNSFVDIDDLYKEGLLLKRGLLTYDMPLILSKDRFAWLRDDEFAREVVAGVNPVSIERLKVFPPKSTLDHEIYGPLESALKEEHIVGHLSGMSVHQALEQSKLFMLDYHDVYLPFLDKINSLDGRKAYATRTIFFLTDVGTLKPIAIELSLPPGGPKSRSKRVVAPPVDATTSWIWQLAKAHVCANDAGVHQLVNHLLRTHVCLEPFILAAHRQLSVMHPIHKLLDPHMRYTLEINALARQNLINADGVVELCFSPGRYAMEISAAAYKNSWRFDKEGLPADLIRRGVAEPDPTQPHGLKLLINDYPYAQDGLLIWSAIENWVSTYVKHYYPNSSMVWNDKELQAWYAESVNVGHSDICHADWWPTLATPADLVSILTTIIWLASAQHAALNFGQYPYGGYVPNRPPLMRRLIPDENDPDHAYFLSNPQKYFLSALPSLLQSTRFMAVVNSLSTHSPDEEYLGERKQPSTWTDDAEMINSFHEFSMELRRIEEEIGRRNADPDLKNRSTAAVIPYELLAPSSGPGVTCRGVPNSVTI